MDDDLKRSLAILFFLFGAIFVGLLLISQYGCAASRPATYQSELVLCNQTAKSLAESLACEDAARARYGRPPRDAGADR